MSLNKFQFIGNLTREVELRYTPDQKPVATIDIAVNDSYKDKSGEKQENVNYFRLTAWGKQAENHAEYLGKGSPIFAEGHLENDDYEKNGQKVYGFKFIVDSIQYLGSKKGGKEKGGEFTV
uniref:single-stranded DNA-binding protein n=1 Tax=Sulfuriferula sp. GW6 TaxID=3345112 RepID=UPI0039F64B04